MENDQSDIEYPDIEVPFDPTEIDIVPKTMSIRSLLDRLVNADLDLTPDFQRQANLWDRKRKSRLIESILLRIPLPSFYFSENQEGVYTVVDGLQRLSTIFHFSACSELNYAIQTDLEPFYLTGLQYLDDLEGRYFEDLDRKLQRRINELEIAANVIRASTPAAVKFNVFARLNQGGLPLNGQEIRNAIYPGPWRERIRYLAESQEFVSSTGGRVKKHRQADMELALRFVCLYALGRPNLRTYHHNLDEFLNSQVENEISTWTDVDWDNCSQSFFDGLNRSVEIFGEHSFRKSIGEYKRTAINKSLFEVETLILSQLSADEYQLLKAKKREFLDSIKFQIDINGSFGDAITYNTGSAESSNTRMEKFRDKIAEMISND